ncbi:MAG: flagellar motor switch protein FliG [Candidatus Omnitrophica bacterium]|nr:flagellar motor switch protein FliG [Candidatus Omnitrophota bacterium]MBD3269881.1 flagellar motor switch protein FliG [Candidatus Omnitrophota bacterium]
MAREDLNNYKKAAIIIVSLGIDLAVQIFKYLDERDVEIISKEIAKLGTIDKEEMTGVIKEFHNMLLSAESEAGGIGYLKEILSRSLGPHKTMEIIGRLSEIRPFSYFENTSSSQIAEILSKEDPQIIALVFSYLPSAQAGEVFSLLPEDLRQKVSMKMVSLANVHREAIDSAHNALEKVVSTKEGGVTEKVSFEGMGIKTLASILNTVPQQVEKDTLEQIKRVDEETADKVRNNMFIFEDLITLEDVALQKALRQVDMRDLTFSLKVADEKLKDKIFKNLSERVRDACKEELSYLGPVRVSQVEEAQHKLIDAVRKLEAAGEIVIPRKGKEEEYV